MKRFDFKGIKPVIAKQTIFRGKAKVSTRIRDVHAYAETEAQAREILENKGYIDLEVSVKPTV